MTRLQHAHQHQSNTTRRFFLFIVLVLTPYASRSVLVQGAAASSLGGEVAFYDTNQMAPNIRHRQNFCDRCKAYDNGTVLLKDALEGAQLNLAMAAYKGAYFNYDYEKGIDENYPGMQAVVLDELARRGGWTWRQSFGMTTNPPGDKAWVDLLEWSINACDVHISWWSPTTERLAIGSAIVKPEWYDASIMLASKERPFVQIEHEINFWNWLRPYDSQVWFLTIFTILMSGIVYQLLEWFADERDGRDWWDWWQENAYLSAINFTQAYECGPKTFASRLFGVSMAIWALVMTATYAANLASLLVDRKAPPPFAETMEEIAYQQKKICTWAGAIGDEYIRQYHPKIVRIQKKTNLETYNGLHMGQCDYVAEAKTNWNRNRGLKEYNPTCDLFWVGGDRIIHEAHAGFVAKADAGIKCSGFIRDVLGFHVHEMIKDGWLELAWEREFKQQHDMNCDTYDADLAAAASSAGSNETHSSRRGRRLLRTTTTTTNRRRLKSGGKGAAGGAVAAASAAAGGGGEDVDAVALTIESMIGTFVFHWVLMAIALVLASLKALHMKYYGTKKELESDTMKEECYDTQEEPLAPGAGAIQRKTTTMSISTHSSDSVLLENKAPPPEADSGYAWKSQMESMMRESQRKVQESQSQMQEQMIQAQKQMLAGQQKLQQQIEAFLAKEGGQRPREYEA